MITDKYGTVGFTQQEVIDYLRINPDFDITNIHLLDGEAYQKARLELSLEEHMPPINQWLDRHYALSAAEYHSELQKVWLTPDEYSTMDIYEWLRNKTQTIEQVERVNEEFALYEKYGLVDLLKYLKFLKDTADKNGIVWGVGRGSSCCSYCLYLLGIHRVDSLKYSLEITDFLRE